MGGAADGVGWARPSMNGAAGGIGRAQPSMGGAPGGVVGRAGRPCPGRVLARAGVDFGERGHPPAVTAATPQTRRRPRRITPKCAFDRALGASVEFAAVAAAKSTLVAGGGSSVEL